MILQASGFSDTEELADALEANPKSTKLKATSAALGILAGGKQKPTLARCLDLFLQDRGRGKDRFPLTLLIPALGLVAVPLQRTLHTAC